jgi:hypothetical protein
LIKGKIATGIFNKIGFGEDPDIGTTMNAKVSGDLGQPKHLRLKLEIEII